MPAERILKAQGVVAFKIAGASAAGGGTGFSPVMDGISLPQQLGDTFASGAGAKVPFIVGTNRDEFNLFLGPGLKQLDQPLDDATMMALQRQLLPRLAPEDAEKILEVYRNSRKKRALPHSDRALLTAIQTDSFFRISSIRFAEAYRRTQPSTFMYFFTYESPAMRAAMRACHGLELPFVFGTLDAPLQDRIAGTGPVVETLRDTMMNVWLAFARDGNPGYTQFDAWPPYEPTRRPTMIFDKQCGVEDAPYEEERAVWDGLVSNSCSTRTMYVCK